MKNNNGLTFIITTGVIILVIFVAVAVYNIIPKNSESNSYYVKVNEEMSAKIEGMEIKNNKLIITTLGDTLEYCIKSTKSTPNDNAICWKKISDNTASISVYKNKKYYVWIKDSKGLISSPMSINTKDN